MSEEDGKEPKNSEMVPVASVETIRKRLDMDQTAFSKALGMSAHSWSNMLRAGKCRKTTALAAEALMRRQAPNQRSEKFILYFAKGVPIISAIGELQELQLNGEKFWLLPQKGG